jgi:hypothetical protein
MKNLSILTVAFLMLTPAFASNRIGAPNRQGVFDSSSMSLEQSVVWLRKTLLGLGKRRLAISATYVCDTAITGVSLDRGTLTINYSETCTEGSGRHTQKLTYEITLADVDAGKVSVVEVEDHKHIKGFNVHIVMAAGKRSKTRQVLTENGKMTRKDFEPFEQEIYLDNREKAHQAVEVLRRMVTLSSTKTSVGATRRREEQSGR